MRQSHVRNIPARARGRVSGVLGRRLSFLVLLALLVVVSFTVNAAPKKGSAGPDISVTARADDGAVARVSVEAVNADVKTVLSALADVARLSVVFADGADGRVTLVLRDVPLNEAMDAVAWAAGLGIESSGSVRAVKKGPGAP